jgi:LmbE family N-acetylglucosaminyl deacetylase
MWGGVPPERSLILGYFQGTLEDMYRDPTAEVGGDRGGSQRVRRYRGQNVSSLLRPDARASWESLVADLVYVLERIRPALIAAPHPVLDVSADHRLTTLALLEALERIGDEEAQLLLYNNHHLRSEYWPYGPADSLMTLAPWFGGASAEVFGSLFSLPLSEEAQIDKLFALEAMHDLRAPPRAELGDPTMRMLRWFRRTARQMWADPHRYYSYFRRGPRPNELFFVIAPRERDALAEAAVEALDS